MNAPDLDRIVRAMLAYAAAHSPYYGQQAWAKAAGRGAVPSLKNIPITPKRDVRSSTELFYVADVPASEGPVDSQFTSGSTGAPMEVRCTARFHKVNAHEAARLSKGWNFEQHRNAVRIATPNTGRRSQGSINKKQYDGVDLQVFYTGFVHEALNFLSKSGATRLTGRPQMVLGILQLASEQGISLPLKLISTVTEVVPEQLPDLIKTLLPGCRFVDVYGTVETAMIAKQCPDCGAYHPAERQSVVEVLDENDRPAKAGKLGRVIVTPLYNLAMPLIRYETGDYALVSKRELCPRSPLSLERIVGRELNLFKLPDGRKIVPYLDKEAVYEFQLKQFKLLQRTPTDVEFLYIPKDPNAELQPERVQATIDRSMAPGFTVKCVKVSELLPAANGKYMMHECLI